MKSIWFTSDLHFGHKKVVTMNKRGYNMGILDAPITRDEYDNLTDEIKNELMVAHDSQIIDNINNYVKPNDILYHLGDFCWQKCGHYRNRINCREIHHINGNHDRSNYANHFSTTNDVKMIKIPTYYLRESKRVRGDKIWLSHYPHAIWPDSHHGSYHLYGHCHTMRETYLNTALVHRCVGSTQPIDEISIVRRSLDVGVDNAYRFFGVFRPFSMNDVLCTLEDRPGHDPVSFYTQFDWNPLSCFRLRSI